MSEPTRARKLKALNNAFMRAVLMPDPKAPGSVIERLSKEDRAALEKLTVEDVNSERIVI